MADAKSIDDIANEAKAPGAGKKAAAEDKMQKQYMDAYKKSKPSGLARLVGLGLGAAAVYFGGPLLASFAPTAKVAATIGSYLGVASQYVTYGLAALTGGSLGYTIPTSMSRAAKANEYMQKSMAEQKKDEKPYNKGPGPAPKT
jgi:hypothetical protein